jgi:TPR repeat protein
VTTTTAKSKDTRRNARRSAGPKASASKAKDNADAERWYRRAAEQGRAEAQNNLGLMYIIGRGVPKNDAEAMKWFSRAAAQGYTPAQNNLAELRRQGRGGKS